MAGYTFGLDPALSSREFVDVLRRSTLHERRPVTRGSQIEAMLRNASIIATARDDRGLLVGVARAISDFAYCTYLSDLAVDEAVQGHGIGRQLIQRVREAAGPSSKLVLLSAPAATGFYPRIGMTRHESCWIFPEIGQDQERKEG